MAIGVLMGGRGSVVGSFYGVLIIAVPSTGLDQIRAEEYIKRIITGSAIMAPLYRIITETVLV